MQMALDAFESFESATDGLYKGEFAEERKALQERLAQPEPWVKTYCGGKPNYTTQPEPQPVAIGEEWKPCVKLPIVVHVREQRKGETHVSTREGITPVKEDDLIMRGVAGEEYPIGRELFNRTYTFNTAPPKREWVGLTEDEFEEVLAKYNEALPVVVCRAIEAKLKEKNT
jgi:hypothetical protein